MGGVCKSCKLLKMVYEWYEKNHDLFYNQFIYYKIDKSFRIFLKIANIFKTL